MPRRRPGGPRTMTRLEREFEDFHRENPEVYRRLVQMSRDLVSRGHRKIGIGMLFEVLRWQHYMSTTDPHSDFKLNNNYRAYYARFIMDECPDLDGVFDVRALRA